MLAKNDIPDPNSTPSTLFRLFTRKSPNSDYTHRDVNMVFENRMLTMFKIISPTIGCHIMIEKIFKIDNITYLPDGKIEICVTLDD
jgi:hypothetical protein